ncbi:MAG TPA: ABC transporter substrate-binding protein, partial [Anaeromyxobacteraceae bacterium]|nr:ABC transporter substrate-binding protein [Anaeromyxobacteraceae bacterium]
LAALAAATLSAPSLAAETVKIGGAFSITGNAAAYGAQQKHGVQAAVEDVNKSGKLKGITLELVLEDDGTSKEQGIAVYQRFINKDKVSAIVGPTLSTTATAADPIAQMGRTPVVAVSNTAPKGITDIGDYIWRVSLTEAQVIPSALAIAKAKNPEFLMVSALVEQAAAIVSQARQLGWNVPIMGGNGFNSPKLIANAGPAADGVLVGTAWNKASTDPVNVAFIADQKARGNDPDQFCAQAYTGVLTIAEAIAQSGFKGGREDVKNGFAKVKDLPTPLGKFSFLPNRDGNHAAAIQIVKNGKFEILQ